MILDVFDAFEVISSKPFRAETQLCNACHQITNAEIPHGPPGAPHWQLEAVELVWWQKSSGEICEQIQDPERTGGRDLAEVADHIGHDLLGGVFIWGIPKSVGICFKIENGGDLEQANPYRRTMGED